MSKYRGLTDYGEKTTQKPISELLACRMNAASSNKHFDIRFHVIRCNRDRDLTIKKIMDKAAQYHLLDKYINFFSGSSHNRYFVYKFCETPKTDAEFWLSHEFMKKQNNGDLSGFQKHLVDTNLCQGVMKHNFL